MKQDHSPWDEKTFHAGANTDMDGAVVGRAPGVYRDASNMRGADNSGNNTSLVKIGGEVEVVQPDQPGASTYICIGAIEVKERRVTFWASIQPSVYPPLIQVNGVTMAMSSTLPYVAGRKLQLHKMEDCEGGMVFDANSGGIPLHWDIGKMMAAHAAGEATYFSGMDLSAYQVNPTRPVNRPVFTGFQPIGGGAGLRGGQYWYRIRYVNLNGDRTPDGPELGPVMVPFHKDYDFASGGGSALWPGCDLTGVSALEVGAPTGLGAGLRFRVNNKGNFDSVEVLRFSYNQDAGPDAVPEIKVAYRQTISPGENTVYDIVDSGESLDGIAADDSSVLTYFIKEAKAVRYIDYRVSYLNVKLGGKAMVGNFRDPAGSRLVPFTKSLGTAGHADPVKHCYHRRFQSGERYGIGIMYTDAVGGESFVQSVEEDVLMPSRRTPKTGQSLALSDAPCHAADINNHVGPTFEVFDHDGAVGKSLNQEVVNIMAEGRHGIGGWTVSPDQATTTPSNEDGVYSDDSVPYGPWLKTSWLKPLRPVSPTDWKWGLEYQVNPEVHVNGFNSPTAHNPKIHGVTHHTLGLGFTGLTDQPQGTQGFSMVMSKPAGRVVAQGLFTWSLTGGNPEQGTFASKSLQQGVLTLPDFLAGALGQQIWEALQQPGGGGLKIQLASPLGFASEQYGSVMSAMAPRPSPLSAFHHSSLADVVSYARVLWDVGQVNPTTNSGGFTPAPALPAVPSSGGSAPDHFVGFGTWRNSPATSASGNALYGIIASEEQVHATDGVMGVVRTLKVTLDTAVYGSVGGQVPQAFNHPETKAFHEPWYVVNIIADGKRPKTDEGYVSCNHYQAFVSELGVTTGQNEFFPLADENLDMIQGRLADGIERYIHLRTNTGQVLRFMNREGMTVAQYNQALLTQAGQGWFNSPFTGEQVDGIFQVGLNLEDVLSVQLVSYAAPGSTVEVRYDPRVPVKFFGDRTTAPAIATIVDADADANNPSVMQRTERQSGDNNSIPAWPIFDPGGVNTGWLRMGGALRTRGMGIPFSNYAYNGRYMVALGHGYNIVAQGPSGPRLSVNQWSNGLIDSIRQWKVLFDCESVVPYHLSSYDIGGGKTYPNVNYVMRPYNYNVNGNAAASGVHLNYDGATVYGGGEKALWRFGGIKSEQSPASDYLLVPSVKYFAKPKFGYQEKEDQCNALIWSAKDSPLLQDSPGLKTFPVANIEFLENDKGAGQRLYSASPGNLYAIMEGQVLEILVEKSTAYSPDGTAFSLFAQDNFVGQVVPRSKFAGMPGDSWKTAAEGGAFAGGGKVDALMWCDGNTAYMLAGGQVLDVADGAYRKGLADAWGDGVITRSPRLSGVYDGAHNEFWMSLGSKVPSYLSAKGMSHWQGWYGYKFDDFLFSRGKMYGFRALSTYELNAGDVMNGTPTLAWVKVATAPANDRMEWVRIKLNGPRKPSRIEWYDEEDVLVAWMDEATFGPYYIKKETSGSWAQWVPRKNISVDPDKKRIQGRVAYYKVMYDVPGADKIITSGVQVKALS